MTIPSVSDQVKGICSPPSSARRLAELHFSESKYYQAEYYTRIYLHPKQFGYGWDDVADENPDANGFSGESKNLVFYIESCQAAQASDD